MTEKFTPKELEIIEFSEQLIQQSPEDFYNFASNLFEMAEPNFLLRHALIAKMYDKKLELLEQGNIKLASLYNDFSNGERCSEDMGDLPKEDWDDFYWKIQEKSLQQKDYKTGVKFLLKRFVIYQTPEGDFYDIDGNTNVDEEDHIISWLDKHAKVALEQDDFQSAYVYTRGQVALAKQGYEYHYDAKENKLSVSSRPELKNCLKRYEELADIALEKGEKATALHILREIKDTYSHDASEPVQEDDWRDYSFLNSKLQRLEKQTSLEAVFEQMKQNFSSQIQSKTLNSELKND